MLLFICLPGWLVSHFLSFVSLICLPGWVLVVGFPAGLSPTSFHLSSTSFHLSGLGACGRVCGWLVSHVLSFVSHFFHLSPTSFHLSPSSFHFLSPRLGACGRVPGWLVSHFLSFVSYFFSLVSFPFICLLGSVLVVGFPAGLLPLPFICLPLLFICLPVLFIVSQAGCLWSGSRLACLPLPFICLPLLFIPQTVYCYGFSCFKDWSPWCWMVWSGSGRLVSHFLSFVSQFFSFVSQFFSVLFICLPGLGDK